MLPHGLLELLASSLCLLSTTTAKSIPVPRQVFDGPTVQPAGPPSAIDPAGVYIRATHLQDGSLVAGYAAPDGPAHVLRLAHSGDSGASWQARGEIARGAVAQHDLDNAFPLQLDSGRLVLAFRNHDREGGFPGADWRYTHYRITVAASEDGGRSWGFLSQVDERPAVGVNGLWEPFLRLDGEGVLQVYYSAENDGRDQDNLMRFSEDDGATWSDAVMVSGEDVVSRDGMTGVADVDENGTLICVFENTKGNTPFSVDYVISRDDGYSWGERGNVYTATGPNKRSAGAPQVWNVGGTLVASFMTNEDIESLPQVDGGHMKVVTSIDGGLSWGPNAVITGERGSHWPGLIAVNDTNFLTLYSKDGEGAVSQMYKLAE